MFPFAQSQRNVAKLHLRMLPISIHLSSCMSPYNILGIAERIFVLSYFGQFRYNVLTYSNFGLNLLRKRQLLLRIVGMLMLIGAENVLNKFCGEKYFPSNVLFSHIYPIFDVKTRSLLTFRVCRRDTRNQTCYCSYAVHR